MNDKPWAGKQCHTLAGSYLALSTGHGWYFTDPRPHSLNPESFGLPYFMTTCLKKFSDCLHGIRSEFRGSPKNYKSIHMMRLFEQLRHWAVKAFKSAITPSLHGNCANHSSTTMRRAVVSVC